MDMVITLREVLEQYGANETPEAGFTVLKENTNMQVNWRYLNSEPMKYLLDWEVIDIFNSTDIWGRDTLVFVIVEPSKKEAEEKK